MCSVTPLTTGRVRLKRGERGVRRYVADDWRPDTLPVNVFLVEHPDGLCLFDAGQTARAALPGYFPRWYPFFRLARFELGRLAWAERGRRRKVLARNPRQAGVYGTTRLLKQFVHAAERGEEPPSSAREHATSP